ncbi:MAG: glucans biosynthesis glucosyltransferase MdoH [Alphaproteobacteria bacterium]|nr:glucans biosynthesis glucosyltransferase MdoH [Alphaproteobacteria bacterium]
MSAFEELGLVAARHDAVEGRVLRRRRAVFAGLVGVSCLALFGWMARILGADGYDMVDLGMLALYAGTLPWVVIGLWNAIIGVALIQLAPDWLRRVLPLDGLEDVASPVTAPTAIVMPVYNEDPDRVIAHLRVIEASLAATDQDAAFEFFLLSDTQDPVFAAEEERLFAAWRRASTRPERLHYRRRLDNARQKVGNLESFCDRWGHRFRYMVVLDADSLMSGDAILRLTRLMERNPTLGILQSLVIGLPARSGFGRLFQFGMRHGMRSYTTGSAWWQGDAGPYWGHNAILRLKPFMAHCRLPRLAGEAPLGGDILSHDQVEAALMRAAGYDVRVLPVEGGSYEENPPTLLDFIKRDLRWCQGNMQYLGLLGWPVWRPLGRVQLALAVLMYLSAPFWMGFLFLGLIRLIATGHDPAAALAFMPAVQDRAASGEGIALFVTMMTITFAPKIMGVLDILLSADKRARYGGGARVLIGSLAESVFGLFLAPIMAVTQTFFIAGLFLGRRVIWSGQTRDPRAVAWHEAARALWPQTLIGALFVYGLAAWAPNALPWAVPILGAWLLSIPYAVLSASPRFGRALSRFGLCGTPEETATPPEIRAVLQAEPLPRPVLPSAGPLAPTSALGHAVPSRPES